MNIPGSIVKVKFLAPFKDGSIFGSQRFITNQVVTLDDSQYNQAVRSGAEMEVLERLVPNPAKAKKVDVEQPEA